MLKYRQKRWISKNRGGFLITYLCLMYSVTGIIMYKQDRCSTKAIKLLATFHNTSKIEKMMKGGLKLIRY